ncbi:OsmC family protein [Prochlorococcus sp. AH-716-K03]|nr:OsmC family protein [Prochlorococcus sp. AH-716-K03]
MSKITCSYLGDLKCEAKHLQSGNLITTDAPIDHCGKGENFSPTDLLATSLGTCLLTIMSIKARSNGWELKNIYLNIEKIMTKNEVRKIALLKIDIYIPDDLSIEKIDFIKNASKDCPVTRNLSESLDIKINWHNQKLYKNNFEFK